MILVLFLRRWVRTVIRWIFSFLMDAPVVPGCVIRARPVGAIEAKQKAKGDDWQRNDRLIAVAAHAQTHQNVQSLKDLRPASGR